MKDIILYTVVPQLPSRLSPLLDLAKNIWFSWNLPGIDLFRSIDPNLWRRPDNPGHAGAAESRPGPRLYQDEGFLLEMDRIHEEFRRYRRSAEIRFRPGNAVDFTVAYFPPSSG
jgi:starch phosphorylase